MEEMKQEDETPAIAIPETTIKPNYKKDIRSILLLFALYILQGIPLGLIVTVPFLLQSRGVSYKEQAKFSLAFWPFGLKVLYAPIIDSVYSTRLGRRKSWLIPLQYLISLFLFILAFQVDDLFESGNVTALTAMFFVLNFLAASQDVAVDGWALTMLSPENVGYASTCNAIGQTLGLVISYSGFLALNSPTYANYFRSVPSDTGLVTLPQFLLFWAIVFVITTTLILFFKREAKESAEVSEVHMNVLASYKSLLKILKLRNIQILALFLLTVRIGTAANDGLSRLKLVASGVPKETLAIFVIPLIPFKLMLPLLTAKWTTGSSPMRIFVNTIPLSMCFGIIYPLIVYFAPGFKSEEGTFGMGFKVFLFGIFVLELIPGYTRFVCGMGFAAKISDPAIGGTYMTLINTITNVGGTWPTSLALFLVDYVAIPLNNDCAKLMGQESANLTNYSLDNYTTTYDGSTAESFVQENSTVSSGIFSPVAECISKIDGYYVESVFCVVVGFLWLIWGRPTILRLQRKPRSSWRIF